MCAAFTIFLYAAFLIYIKYEFSYPITLCYTNSYKVTKVFRIESGKRTEYEIGGKFPFSIVPILCNSHTLESKK